MRLDKHIIPIIFVVFMSSSFAQTNKEYLRSVLKQTASHTSLEKKQSYFLDMIQRVEYAPELKKQPVEVRTKMILREGKMLFENKYMSVYADKEVTVMVQHTDKTIVLSPSGLENWNYQARVNEVALLQDSIVKTGTVLSTTTIGANKKRYVLKVSDSFRKSLNVSRIFFDVNTTTNQLYQVTNVSVPGAAKRKEIIKYISVDYNYVGKPFTKALDVVFSGKTLRYKYQQYSVLDTRK